MNFTKIKSVIKEIDVPWHWSAEAVVQEAKFGCTYWRLFHRFKVKNQPYKQVRLEVFGQIDNQIFHTKHKISQEIER